MLSNKQIKLNKSDLARKLNSARENQIELIEPVSKETLIKLNDQIKKLLLTQPYLSIIIIKAR